MAIKRNLFFIVLSGVLLTACNPTKYLPEGQVLYTGASVTVKGPQTARERKILRTELQGLTRPRPNSRILGIPFKLDIYNLFRNKKPNSFWGKLRDKYGEPPVLLSSVDLSYNEKVLESHAENTGYFRAQVTGDTVVKKRKAKAEYTANTGEQYTISSVHFDTTQSALTQAIRESGDKSILLVGKPFNLDVIKAERNRIDAFLKERGFYFFSPDDLLIKTDTTVGNHKADLYVVVKDNTPDAARDVYYINKVFIYSNYNLGTARLDTNKANAVGIRKGFNVIDREHIFKRKMFRQIMLFEPGDIYNRTDHNLTLQRLINLNAFKFVKNRFEVVPSTDSSKLDAYYYLTPMPKKSLQAQITGTQKSNNLTGTEITFSWQNRNAFRGAEQVKFSTYIGTEVQAGGTLKGHNTYRTGAQLDFTFPRFVVPFFNLNTRGGYVPRTNIRLGYDILNKRKLYSLNQYRVGYGFLWKENNIKQHEFYPISVNFVKPLNITQQYTDSIKINPIFARSTEQQFILGSTYQYTYNPIAAGIQKINSFFFSGLADVSGNIAGLASGANIKKGDTVKLFNTPFSQYLKFEADGRFYKKIGFNSTWANRIILGFGLPYGNSNELPFIKQFFVGGNNSLRGFRSRSVGPGIYHPFTTNGFLPDLTGDIKLEMNTELRPKIYGPLYGAVFLDAGNVWLYNKHITTTDSLRDPPRPGGEFSKDFLKQLAVDVGVGMRLDIQFFVIRLDVAFPINKPWLTPDNTWVIRDVRFNSKEWRGDNIIYNLAIGYPF